MANLNTLLQMLEESATIVRDALARGTEEVKYLTTKV